MFQADFSPATRKGLARQSIAISGGQAVPAFAGDQYFTGRAYGLVKDGCYYLRSYSQVVAIAKGEASL